MRVQRTLDAALGAVDNDGRQELIPVVLSTTLVPLPDGLDGVGALLSLAQDHALEGDLDSLPALIAVHGPVTADDGGDLANAELFKLADKLLHVSGTRLGIGITAVTEEVDVHLGDLVLLGSLQQGVQVVLLGVLLPS